MHECCDHHAQALEKAEDVGKLIDDVDYVLSSLKIPVMKALNPLRQRDFVRMEAKLVRKLRSAFGKAASDDMEAVQKLVRQVDLTSPGSIERFVKASATAMKGLENGVAKEIAPQLEVAIEDMYKAAKIAAINDLLAKKRIKSRGEIKAFGFRDEEVVNMLNKHTSLFINDGYKSRIKDWDSRSKAILTRALEEGWSRKEVTERLMKAFGNTVNDPGYWSVVGSSWLNRARNWSQLEAFSEAGIEEYEIMEAMDERTCMVCRAMNGKRFSVKKQVTIMEKAAQTETMADFSWTTPWLTGRVGEKGDEDYKVGILRPDGRFVQVASGPRLIDDTSKLQYLGFALPPFHGLCRGTIIGV